MTKITPHPIANPPLIPVLRHLLMIASLLLSLAGHGTAMAQAPEAPAGPAVSAHAMHHGAAAHCESKQSCPAPASFEACCVIGHCLLGLVAEWDAPLPPFEAAAPVPLALIAPLAEPQANPERPPRLS
jgi:hypothetical protein